MIILVSYMNEKVFVINKVLQNVPLDIKFLIIEELKKQEGAFISNSLRIIYYYKVYLNSSMFSTLCCYSIYFQNIIEDNLILFLIYVKNNITVSYIMDVFLWVDKLIRIKEHYRYKNKSVTMHCLTVLEHILSTRLKKIQIR